MSYETAQNTITTRFDAQVATPNSIPTQYDNAPEVGRDSSGRWYRASVRFGAGTQVSNGTSTPRFRRFGSLLVQVFGPLEEGAKNVLEAADFVADAFRAVTASGVTFRTPSIEAALRNEDSWQVNVSCPFYTDLVI